MDEKDLQSVDRPLPQPAARNVRNGGIAPSPPQVHNPYPHHDINSQALWSDLINEHASPSIAVVLSPFAIQA